VDLLQKASQNLCLVNMLPEIETHIIIIGEISLNCIFTIYINYSHWHQCLYCVLFLWEETRAPEESNMPCDLCVYPMIGLKRCRNQDI